MKSNYRSPQQLPHSRKPNIENQPPPPQKSALDHIKHMKKRECDTPLSIITQDSHIQEAKSIIIDMSRIEHPKIQPSVCSTQRTNRYEMMSQPYLEQPSLNNPNNISLMYFQQQMLQLQNENLVLKQRLEQQESQKMLIQQQLQQQLIQQAQQQPIVINNNILAPDQGGDPQKRLYVSKPHSILSGDTVEFKSPKICQQTQTLETEKSISELRKPSAPPVAKADQSLQVSQNFSEIEVRMASKPQAKPDRSIERRDHWSTPKINQWTSCRPSHQFTEGLGQDVNVSNQQSYNTENPSWNNYKANNTNNTNQTAMTSQTNQTMVSQENLFSHKPSVKMEFNFNDEAPNTSRKQMSLADCFLNRKRQTERKVSAPIVEESQMESWIVKVKQRSKEEQMRLRKEMMEFGRSRRQLNTNKSEHKLQNVSVHQEASSVKRVASPLMERLAQGQKAKVEPKEMYALTRKNYENLPEVKSKKEEEERKQSRQNFRQDRQTKLKELNEKIKGRLVKPKK